MLLIPDCKQILHSILRNAIEVLREIRNWEGLSPRQVLIIRVVHCVVSALHMIINIATALLGCRRWVSETRVIGESRNACVDECQHIFDHFIHDSDLHLRCQICNSFKPGVSFFVVDLNAKKTPGETNAFRWCRECRRPRSFAGAN